MCTGMFVGSLDLCTCYVYTHTFTVSHENPSLLSFRTSYVHFGCALSVTFSLHNFHLTPQQVARSPQPHSDIVSRLLGADGLSSVLKPFQVPLTLKEVDSTIHCPYSLRVFKESRHCQVTYLVCSVSLASFTYFYPLIPTASPYFVYCNL